MEGLSKDGLGRKRRDYKRDFAARQRLPMGGDTG
jgi:hypothetical protein